MRLKNKTVVKGFRKRPLRCALSPCQGGRREAQGGAHKSCRPFIPCFCYDVRQFLGGSMGQLGFSEMLMIFVIALLVFGPKKLPELGKSLGKGIREFKKATEELKSSWEDQVKDVTAPLNDVKRDINNIGQ